MHHTTRRNPPRLAATVAITAILATGCGSRTAPDTRLPGQHSPAVHTGVSEPTAPTDVAVGAPATGDTTPTGQTGTVAPAATSPPHQAAPRRSRHNDGSVRIDLDRPCVRPGQILRVTFVGPADSGFAAIVAFPDGSGRATDMITGKTDPNGRFIWPILIPVDMTPGTGRLMVSMTGSAHGPGGSADRDFPITPTC